jgi:hypothetical protein
VALIGIGAAAMAGGLCTGLALVGLALALAVRWACASGPGARAGAYSESSLHGRTYECGGVQGLGAYSQDGSANGCARACARDLHHRSCLFCGTS